ncbi:hypothetical protein DFH29DRAFT_819127 [Suillus ampliporus]|nr:hypothetical protein DFH29DRAFT_819127 [Suillus ampliporus]
MPSVSRLPRDVVENVLKFLDLLDLESFAQTSVLHESWVVKYVHHRRSVLFALFLIHIPEFIALLDRTQSVVSGLAALSLIQSEEEATAIQDIDVYTTEPYQSETLQFLKEVEGYETISNFCWLPIYWDSAVVNLVRLCKGDRRMDVIITNYDSSITPLFQFHSTPVMNFISAHTICCAYPAWTLSHKGLIHPRIYTENATNLSSVAALNKYSSRGFNLLSDIADFGVADFGGAHHCYQSYYCPQTTRNSNDQGMLSWVIDHASLPPGTFRRHCTDVLPVVWCIGGNNCNNEVLRGMPSFVFVRNRLVLLVPSSL